MEKSQNLITRDDTMFGICEALGEDFGFNPLWLRLGLGVGLLWNPAAVAVAYGTLGVLVLISRLLSPDPRRAAEPEAAEPQAAEAAPAEAAAPAGPEPLPIAA